VQRRLSARAAMLKLSVAQRAAVDAAWKDTRTLIVACAGSGKTTVMAHRAVCIAAELHRGASPPPQLTRPGLRRGTAADGATGPTASGSRRPAVLCLCFGSDAADELSERIIGIILDQNLERQLVCHRRFSQPMDTDRVSIYVTTLHAFGYRLIVMAGRLERRDICGLQASDRRPIPKIISYTERAALIAECMREVGLKVPDKETPVGKADFKRVVSKYTRKLQNYKVFCCDMANLENVAAGGRPPKELDNSHLFGQELELYDLYCEMLCEQNQIEFCDMLRMGLAILSQSTRVAKYVSEQFAAVLVDEFQDLSPSELALVHRLSSSVSLVGDDDQNIYSFKNAVMDWQCLKQAGRLWKDMRTLTLAENRRCPGNVVTFASAVVAAVHGRIPKAMTALRHQGARVDVVGTGTAELEAQFIALKIKELLQWTENGNRNFAKASGNVCFRDIAVLGRVNADLTSLMRKVKDVRVLDNRNSPESYWFMPISHDLFVS
jgi:superfamily I DNA/RNA helicase